MTIKTINRKANSVGLSLRKGYQRYMHPAGGYFRTLTGKRITGYSVYDYYTGFYQNPHNQSLVTNDLTWEEAVDLIKEMCAARGLTL